MVAHYRAAWSAALPSATQKRLPTSPISSDTALDADTAWEVVLLPYPPTGSSRAALHMIAAARFSIRFFSIVSLLCMIFAVKHIIARRKMDYNTLEIFKICLTVSKVFLFIMGP